MLFVILKSRYLILVWKEAGDKIDEYINNSRYAKVVIVMLKINFSIKRITKVINLLQYVKYDFTLLL